MEISNNNNKFIELLQNLDGKLDYQRFYEEFIPNLKAKGTQLHGSCPFPEHKDTHPSFSASKLTGQYLCHGCGKQGNALSFLMKLNNLTSYEALKKLYEYAQLQLPQSFTSYSILQSYCTEKKLPLNFIQKLEIIENNGVLMIPYKDKNNVLIRYRYRHPFNSDPKHTWGPSLDRPIDLYGLWLMNQFNDDFIILVEGESDTHTLLLNNFPCLGVPGAVTFKDEWVEHLRHYKKIYLYIDPDTGGKKFFEKTINILAAKDYKGEVFTFQFNHFKDPNAAWCSINNSDDFVEFIEDHLSNATCIDLKTKKEKQITFSPIPLKGLKEHDVTKKGVYHITKTRDESNIYIPITSTPIVISGRIKLFNSPLEQIEISYYLDNHWHTAILMRSELFNTRNIIKLADLGINISTINAKQVVYYLQTLESSNREMFSIKKAINRFGWYNNFFLPFGDEKVTILNENNELRNLWSAFSVKGDLMEQIEYIYSVINNHPIVRLCVMASLASPFFKDLEQRIMCIYFWADSKSGKTAALQLALSVWGDPRKLMKNFNATACGIEEMAHILNSLPLGLNERQQKNHDKASQQLLETLLYMLAEGTGRTKSTKDGGVKQTTDWHNVILANGEVPLLSEHTHSGARNRCLEINGKPFSDEETARIVYNKVNYLHGGMGHALVTKVLMSSNYTHIIDTLKKQIRQFELMLISEFPNKNSSHLSLIATIIAIDYYVTSNLFKSQYSLTQEEILSLYKVVIEMLPNILDYDLTENFYSTVKDWLNSNRMYFETAEYTPAGKLLGLLEVSDTNISYFIYQEAFRELCQQKNLSAKQMLESFAHKEYIKTERPNGKGRRTVRKTLHGVQQSFIQFDLNIVQKGDF